MPNGWLLLALASDSLWSLARSCTDYKPCILSQDVVEQHEQQHRFYSMYCRLGQSPAILLTSHAGSHHLHSRTALIHAPNTCIPIIPSTKGPAHPIENKPHAGVHDLHPPQRPADSAAPCTSEDLSDSFPSASVNCAHIHTSWRVISARKGGPPRILNPIIPKSVTWCD